MNIEYGQLRSLTARKIINALESDGFRLKRQKGSHRHYFNDADRRRVTVTFHHSSDTFRLKTLRSMIELQAGWSVADLQRLGIL